MPIVKFHWHEGERRLEGIQVIRKGGEMSVVEKRMCRTTHYFVGQRYREIMRGYQANNHRREDTATLRRKVQNDQPHGEIERKGR